MTTTAWPWTSKQVFGRDHRLISDGARQWREFRRAVDAGVQASLRGYYRAYPRTGERWSPAEDRRLLRLVRRHAKLAGLRLWVTVARALGRTTAATQTRHSSLLAGMRLTRRR